MSILVEFSISTDRFALGNFISRYEGLEAELERIVPTEDRAIPYVWVTGPPETLDELTDTLDESGKTDDVTVLDDLSVNNSGNRSYLYRIEWVLDDLDIIKGIISAQGSVLEGEASNHYWRLRFRFEKHQRVAEFYQYLADNEITDFTIDSIYELTNSSGRDSKTLTPQQREALTVAAQDGYFDIPRETNLKAIGDELGITQQATSERVRRGVRNVVFDTLTLPETSRD